MHFRFGVRHLTQIVEGADVLKAHGVIHTDANPADFLPFIRVVTGAKIRNAAVDEEDWKDGKEERYIARQRAVMLEADGWECSSSVALCPDEL
ncbi:hypothetical protein PsYK624_054770 [Phanerochaete sordida]|uniref:Uncharacterized protein n=1 Tax=Phanerochaete sordida TaxID=48140 RepID=A0A9P3G556_9APHY|nr:hypothetical protein PsYK624_054770 [Phanerochaete sordida]